MYLPKVISRKTYKSIGQRAGSADPDPYSDPYQNDTDKDINNLATENNEDNKCSWESR